MRKPLRVAIATGGRFHVLDLARELDALGHAVRFYSYVPRARAEKFGLPQRCHVALLPLLWPLAGWDRVKPAGLPRVSEKVWYHGINKAVMARLQPCDVFIGMSGLILEAAQFARRKFGAKIYLERGSRHILSQRDILAAIPGAEGPSDFAIERELAGYALADRIAVPSQQVVDSFLERDATLAAKLFVNPYGVDLAQFPQRAPRKPAGRVVLFVGAWTLQKGADLLVETVKSLPDVQLLHVGTLGDVPFPQHPRFTHHDPVPQWELKTFYAAADVFCLASRQDGFGLVLAQALACGLPIVCTDRTGGADLGHTEALAERITVVPHGNVAALADAIGGALEGGARGMAAELSEEDRLHLSWASYGRRYAEEIIAIADRLARPVAREHAP